MLDKVGRVQDEESCTDLYRRYLHDYIRSVHQVTHKQSSVEYKVSCVQLMMFFNETSLFSFTADRGGSEHHDQ